jgi:preprotein translocase subunit SecY
MASAAEQFASNLNFGAFARAKELQKRILFTLFVLIVYRVGTYIPMPGVDPAQFAAVFQQQQGGILGMFNVFSGGAVERMAIFALNVMPYISASIIMQLMAATVPSLERLKKEGGEQGRKQINQYSRYLTVVLAALQAFAIAVGMENPDHTTGATMAIDPGWFFRITTVVTLVGGTMMLLWLGEQITARGVGNGVSLIIFAGIIAEMPRALFQALEQGATGALPGGVILVMIALILLVLVFVVFMERSQRRLLVQYPKRQVGNRMMGGESSFLPLKLNTAGVIPAIFASSLLLLPATLAGFSQDGPQWLMSLTAMLGHGQPLFILFYGGMIVFFTFFYVSIVFNPEDTADNLKKYGGFLPGIRPGKRTAEYIDYVLSRLTVIGAAYLAAVCVLPEVLRAQYPMIPFYIGGTALLIVVSVTLDTVSQIQSHLLAHQYEGLIKKTKLRGRKR